MMVPEGPEIKSKVWDVPDTGDGQDDDDQMTMIMETVTPTTTMIVIITGGDKQWHSRGVSSMPGTFHGSVYHIVVAPIIVRRYRTHYLSLCFYE